MLVFGFTWHENQDGLIMRDPNIIEIDRNGEVTLHQNSASIGNGSVIADSTLYQREQNAYGTLETTLYHLYEASKPAHFTAPSVGAIGEFLVIDSPEEKGGKIGMMRANAKCLEIMEETFQIVAPKTLPPIVKLEDDCFEVIVPQTEDALDQPSESQTSEDQP